MHNFTVSITTRILGQMADRIAAQVRGLSRTPVRMAEGSLIDGLIGSDGIPAMLTADKFAIRESAGSQLGAWFLDVINRDAQPQPAARASVTSREQATVNNFGGISIHVREASDVNTVVRDLRFQGLQLRNRRG